MGHGSPAAMAMDIPDTMVASVYWLPWVSRIPMVANTPWLPWCLGYTHGSPSSEAHGPMGPGPCALGPGPGLGLWTRARGLGLGTRARVQHPGPGPGSSTRDPGPGPGIWSISTAGICRGWKPAGRGVLLTNRVRTLLVGYWCAAH